MMSPGKSAGLSSQPIASPSLVAGRPVIGAPAQCWAVAQMVEHGSYKAEVAGSSPACPTSNLKEIAHGRVCQKLRKSKPT